jgi:hypothetical protein
MAKRILAREIYKFWKCDSNYPYIDIHQSKEISSRICVINHANCGYTLIHDHRDLPEPILDGVLSHRPNNIGDERGFVIRSLLPSGNVNANVHLSPKVTI